MVNYYKSKFKDYLSLDEELLWVGTPSTKPQINNQDIFFTIFAIFWTSFAFIWEGIAILFFLSKPNLVGIFMVIFGLPFLVVGLYILLGRSFYEKKKIKSTIYGITNRRVIILLDTEKIQVKSFELDSITNLSIQENQGGYGTITIDIDGHYYSRRNSRCKRRGFIDFDDEEPILQNIPDVVRVYSTLREAVDKVKK